MKHHSKAERTLGFKIHAIAFAVVLPLLAVINLWTGPPYWVLWTLAGWGVGLASHWWFVLGPGAAPARNPLNPSGDSARSPIGQSGAGEQSRQ